MFDKKTVILYILAKRHEHIKICITSFHPILSNLGTPDYKLVNVFVPLLTF